MRHENKVLIINYFDIYLNILLEWLMQKMMIVNESLYDNTSTHVYILAITLVEWHVILLRRMAEVSHRRCSRNNMHGQDLYWAVTIEGRNETSQKGIDVIVFLDVPYPTLLLWEWSLINNTFSYGLL